MNNALVTNRINQIRERRGVTLSGLARRLRKSPAFVSMKLREIRQIDFDDVELFADALGITPTCVYLPDESFALFLNSIEPFNKHESEPVVRKGRGCAGARPHKF